MSVVEGRPLNPGARTLQDAYDADTTAPQLVPTLGDNFTINGQVNIDQALDAGEANALLFSDTASLGAFIGGSILSNGTITYTSTTFIWALLQESKLYLANAGAGFAAFTLFNALAAIRNGTNAALVQALVLNNGVAHQSTGAVAATTIQSIGLSNSPNTRALTAGGSMTKTTGDTAVRHSPTFGTVAASSIAFGTQRGLHMLNPAPGLFQPSAGTETMTAYIGVDVEAIPFGGNVTKRGLRSFLTAASNTRVIDGQGTAQSDLRGTLNFPSDLVGIQYGAGTDWFEAWAAGGFKIEQHNNAPIEQFQKSFPAAGRMLFNWSNDMELNINCVNGFSLGDQSGANGNQFGNFVQGDFAPGAGEATGFLLTQSGSFTNGGFVRSRASAWVINPMSYANSSGTVTESDTLTIGGMVTSSPGVTITDRQALHAIGGRSRFDSAMQFEPISPAALASGNNNDYAGLLTSTANNNMRHWARLSADAAGSTLTGIDATEAQDGDTFKLTNVSANTLTIGHQDANSLATNRIISPTGANYVLAADESAEIIRDVTTDRWRILYGSGT